MTNTNNEDNDLQRDEAAMARLLRVAGPRAEVPKNAEARVYERVLEQWQASTAAHDDTHVYDKVQRAWKRKIALSAAGRWVVPFALAASTALVAFFMVQPRHIPPVAAGTVAKVVSSLAAGSPFALGDEIYVDTVIETGEGQGLSFLLQRNESLRLDENSTLRVDASDQFTLLRGRAYADTGEFVYRDGGLRIDTAFGAVTDIGTQFSVAVGSDQLAVAVREGRVDVRQDSQKHIAMSGERMTLSRKGNVTIEPLALTDDYWNWTTRLAPAFDLEGKSLMDFLKWASRESGRLLFFEDSELRMAAMRTDLHGSIADFSPLEAIESVLATTTFRHQVEPDRIVIVR